MNNNDLLDKLIDSGLLSAEGVSKAKEATQAGECIWEKLNEFENIEPAILLENLAELSEYAPVRPWRCKIDSILTEMIPVDIANNFLCVPLYQTNSALTLACVEPWNEDMLKEIESLLAGQTVSPVLACVEDIRDSIATIYGNNYESELKDILKNLDGSDISLIDSNNGESAQLDKSILLSLTDQEPVVRLVNSLLKDGVSRKASDIFIEPGLDELVVRYRVDGMLQDGPHPPKSMRQGVISRLKIMSNLDISEQRLPQDGRVRLMINERYVEFRLSTLPTFYGEKACLRILDPGEVKLNLNHLGFGMDDLDRIRTCVKNPYGMVLICGPTGSGKSTTLYSMLNHVDGIEKNLVTVEDPVEFHMDGVNQVNVKSEAGLDFKSALRSILRQDPDVVMIGEIRDKETMEIGVKAALTGHLVLSTLHTNSAAGSITRLINMGIEPFLLTASLLMVGSQRLLRKLCEACREPYDFDLDKAYEFGMQKTVTKLSTYKAKGCAECRQTGYKGRVSIAEILVVTPEIRQLIIQRSSEGAIKAKAREQGMVTLRENAMRRFADGITSLDEGVRVSTPDKDHDAVEEVSGFNDSEEAEV